MQQIKLKGRSILSISSGQPLSPAKNELTEIERQLFVELEEEKNQPIGGMHYTENLIELTAMALENPELERGNLKAYSESHSTTDFYILHVLTR